MPRTRISHLQPTRVQPPPVAFVGNLNFLNVQFVSKLCKHFRNTIHFSKTIPATTAQETAVMHPQCYRWRRIIYNKTHVLCVVFICVLIRLRLSGTRRWRRNRSDWHSWLPACDFRTRPSNSDWWKWIEMRSNQRWQSSFFGYSCGELLTPDKAASVYYVS